MRQLSILFLFLIGAMAITSCLEDECSASREVYLYDPVYLTLDEIRSSELKVAESRAIEDPGKIYYQGSTMFISEKNQGVHIFDNSDPSNPQQTAFIEIPGNIDISFKGNHLIADSYLDIWMIDIKDPLSPELISTIPDINSSIYYYDESKDAYIVEYVQRQEPVRMDCSHPDFRQDYGWYYDDVIFANVETGGIRGSDLASWNSSNTTSGGGIAGSLSSFAIVGQYFYFINGTDIHIYDISDFTNPFFVNGFEVAWNIETLFPYKDNLFIGGQNGMYIYDNTDPTNPTYLSEFTHARACDPVFVVDNIAYVTLSEGTACNNFNNQLDVIDITNLTNPQLIKSYPMFKPKGLSVYNNTLFLADSEAGVKIFDCTDSEAITANRLSHIIGITVHEVIHISPTHIIVVGQDGIFQFDVEDPSNPVELSRINTNI